MIAPRSWRERATPDPSELLSREERHAHLAVLRARLGEPLKEEPKHAVPGCERGGSPASDGTDAEGEGWGPRTAGKPGQGLGS